MLKHTLAVVVAGLALSACAGTADYVKQGQELTTQYGGSVDQLIARNQTASTAAAALPSSLAGASDLVTKLAANKTTLDTLKGDLGGYGAKLDAAVKAGDTNAAKALVEQERTQGTTAVPAADKELAALEAQLADLQKQAAATPAAPVAPPVAKQFEAALSTGFALTGNPNGVEAQLLAFIQDAKRPVDKTTWFNFDRLDFKSGSAELDMSRSQSQLTNIVEIMKAFPKVELKIGGYTDNTGKAAANQKLSTDRANTVTAALIKGGVPAKRLAAEGYGDQYPECPANDTDECKAKNRRIAIRVMAK